MARKDVNLVIKAKDEAASVLDQITKALDNFTDASKGVDSGAEKTESSLGQLGAAISTLSKNLGGLDIADKLGSELRKAEKELSRMEGAFDATSAEARALEKDLARAGESSTRFASKTQGATEALARQKTAIKTSKADLASMSDAYSKAEAAQAKLTARQAKLPSEINKQSEALKKAEARYAALADKIERAVEPSKTLQNTFDSSARSVQSNADKLNKLTTEYSQIGGEINAAGSAMALFGGQAEKTASTLKRQETALSKIGSNLTELTAQSKAAAGSQKDLAASFGKINNSLDNQQQRIDRAEGAYVELAQAAGQADGALDALSKQSLGRLEDELKGQRRAALEAKREYAQLSEEATQLATSIRKAEKPTQEMVAAFDRTVITARQAKAEYVAQRAALELMGRAYRETGTDIDSINGTQQRFVAILGTTSAALRKNAQAAQTSQAALDRVNAAGARAANAMQRTGAAASQTAGAMNRGARSTRRFADAYQQFYGDTRRSLGLLQRIRGEVLSLIAAYGGLYGVIEVLRGTVDAYNTLEAAQARLSVATGGDSDRTAQELDFIRRNADRLGISFGVLATEYSKFSIATKGTNIEGEATRKIFKSVAEAARVNRSSTQEMSGVFVALTQIVSKGAVQMEELRQQLGDRLPGALQLMADGLNVSTSELIKMMEAGEVTADALLPFAAELDKRFGPGLAGALSSTSAAIGRLGNEAYESLLRFGQAGFLDAFSSFVDDLTEVLKSGQFRDFADRISVAFAALLNTLGFLAQNFDLVFTAAAAFISLRLAPIIIYVASTLKGLTLATTKSAASFSVLQARAASMGVSITRAGYAVRVLQGALTGLLSATGIGLLIAGIGAGIAYWSTQGSDVTQVMIDHEAQVDRVKNAYDEAGSSAKEWAKSVTDADVVDSRKNLRDLEDALRDSLAAFKKAESYKGQGLFVRLLAGPGVATGRGASKEFIDAVDDVVSKAASGEIKMEDFGDAIASVVREFGEGSEANKRYGDDISATAKEVDNLATAIARQKLVLAAETGTVEEIAAALEELNGTFEEGGDSAEDMAEKAAQLEEVLRKIDSLVPSIKQELDYLAESDALEKMKEQAIALASSMEEVEDITRRTAAAQAALDNKYGNSVAGMASGSTGVEAAASLLREFEGRIETPAWDVNAYRAGYGSDTVTLANGSIKKITQGMRVSAEEATLDLYRRIETEFLPATRDQVGGARFDSFNPQQQGVLTSIAYNYGTLPDRILDAVRTGTDAEISAAIRGLSGDNDGINESRRGKEAAIFSASNPDMAAGDRALEQDKKRREEAERAAEAAQDKREATAETLADGEFELDQQRLVNAGKERQAAIEAAIRDAKAADPNITTEEIAQIKEQTGALFDLSQAKKESTSESEKAKEAEKAVNDLLSLRASLVEQVELAKAQGDTEQEENLRLKIGEVNAELMAAIENAKAMWAAVGGAEAEAAIAKLDVAALKTKNFAQAAGDTYLQWERVGDMIVNGLAGAFDEFTKAVANGEDATKAAQRAFLKFASDFLIQIAQMIIKQAIFNALKSAFGGTGFGSLIGVGHTGGLVGGSRVGSGNSTRRVSPAMFAGAARYHQGGVVGLKPGEVPIIAEQGEEMLTRDDPRHMLNGGGKDNGAETQKAMTIINTFDPVEAVERALATRRGEEVLVNAVRAKRTEVKAAIG